MGNDITSFGQYRVSVMSFATFANGYSAPCPDETETRSFRFGEDKFLDTHNNVGTNRNLVTERKTCDGVTEINSRHCELHQLRNLQEIRDKSCQGNIYVADAYSIP